MKRQGFRKELKKALEESLPGSLIKYVDQQRELREQTVRYIYALNTKFSESSDIQQKLNSLLDILNKERSDQQNIIALYEKELAQILQRFPEMEEWEQLEDRFSPQPHDSLITASGKRIKRFWRTFGKRWHKVKSALFSIVGSALEPYAKWEQTVLPKNIVESHLLDSEMVLGWLHSIKRRQLFLIMSIENYLAGLAEGKIENADFDLKELAESLDENKEYSVSQIEDEIRIALKDKYAKIVSSSEKTGTFERRTSTYRESNLVAKRDKAFKTLEKGIKAWEVVLETLGERARIMTEYILLQKEVHAQTDSFLDRQTEFFQDLLLQPLQELRQKLKNSTEAESLENFSSLQEELKSFFDGRIISPIRKGIQQDVLAHKIERFSEKILNQANTVSEKNRLITKMDLDKNPPQIAEREVGWRLLVVRSIRENILNALQPFQEVFTKLLSEMLEELEETAGVIDVNLESAASLPAESELSEGESAESIAREALQRALANIELLEKKLDTELENFASTIREGENSFNELLFSIIYEGDTQNLQMLNAKYKARETTRDWKSRSLSRLALIQDKISLWIRFGGKKAKIWYEKIGAFLGFQELDIEEQKRADIATYLSETDQKIQELPYIYRQLFNFSGTADARFYIPVSDATSVLKKAYNQWNNLFSVSVALVGEKGSGKSSFLDHIPDGEISDHEMYDIVMERTISAEKELVEMIAPELGITDADSVDQMISEINSRDKRMVVALEDIQHCYVRNINGYEAMEKLCYLISETRNQVFWLVSCSRYAWQFLDKALQLSEYFSYVTVCDDLDPDQIKKVILSRHRASGYTLHFETDDEILKSRGYRKLMSEDDQKQEYLQDLYFNKLTQLAEGNASVAMIFWIRSISKLDDTHCYIRPLEVTSLDMIEDLSPRVLFSLAAFVLHDTLTDQQLARVLNLDREESRLTLNRLQARGLLEQKGEVYSINHLMYRQIVRVLKERNIIHLV